MAAAANTTQAANDCIGNLEHHIHRVFASVRVAGEDFVYCSSHELFARLDDFCDESTMAESKPPLLIKGESGTGKTALLANWLHRREHTMLRARSNLDEFIFWHAVGCSRQSLNVNSLLRRLISDLKGKFELARQVPKSQERLSWELPRFLELAAKKGKVIIVIDGLHRLRSNDGGEDGLAWLPLVFPPNVRVILSVTVPIKLSKPPTSKDAARDEHPVETFTPFPVAEAGGREGLSSPQFRSRDGGGFGLADKAGKDKDPQRGNKKSRILSELDRRAIPSITMKALDGSTCRSLVKAYIEKSISHESSQVAAGPFITSMLSDGPQQPMQNSRFVTGFLLFESQVEELLKHELGGNPLFLRLFLRCLHFLCSRGYSMWSVFDDWIKAKSVQELISRILRVCESGYGKSREQAQRDGDLCLSSGGLTEIKRVYAWHPAFRGEDLRSLSDVLPMAYEKSFDPSGKPVDGAGAGGGNGSAASASLAVGGDEPPKGGFVEVDELGKKESAALSNQVLQNLGDQQWITVERQVHRQLERAVIDSRRVVEDVVALDAMPRERASFVEEVLAKIKLKRRETARSAEASVASASHPNLLVRGRTTIIVSGNSSVESEALYPAARNEDGLATSDEDESWDDRSFVSIPRPPHSTSSSPERQQSNVGAKLLSKASESLIGLTKPSHMVQHALVHGESIQFINASELSVDNKQGAGKAADPSEGFFSLPLYMRGGESVSGFGDLIGNALALLYVARQGLKEEELWKILCKLQVKKRLQKKMFQEKRDLLVAQEITVCKIAHEILKSQGMLEDLVMAEDITKLNYIPLTKMLLCVKKCVQQEVKQGEFRQLLEFILKHAFGGIHNGSSSLLNFQGKPFIDNESIHYEQFLVALKRLSRRFHFASASSGDRPLGDTTLLGTAIGKSSPVSANTDDTFDEFFVPRGAADDSEDADDQDGELLDSSCADGGDVLGPVVEESLLNILCALGVLYSPENKVLILPSDSEPFRRTIYDRYILPRGGGSIQYWHNLIIQYFRNQENSLRKCEEMPWHLKICRKWTTLKDCLVDLKTFDLMFNNDLKDELMDYWRLLTEGPLFVVDPTNLQHHLAYGGNAMANSGAMQPSNRGHGMGNNRSSFLYSAGTKPPGNNDDDDDADNQSTLSHILREIDEAQAQQIPVKDVKRKLMRFQIQPFDVVEELNRSLEAWVTAERPSPQWIHRIILQISRFLLEFSKFTHSCPHFRRLGIDMSVLEKFGLITDELKDVIHSTIPQAAVESADDANAGAPENGKPSAEGPSKSTPAPSKGKDRYFDGVQKQDLQKFPSPKMASGNLYLYLRWIWVQFPWLALHPAASVAVQSESSAVENGSLEGIDAKDDNDDQVVDSSVKHLLRVWNVKKSDPTVPVFTSSLNRKLAAIKPRTSLSSNLERNVNASCKKLYQELAAPSHIAQARLGIGITQRDKFRRTFQQEVEVSKSIPYAYHGVKAMKSGSLFPSYNAQVRETNRKKVEADLYSLDNGDSDSLSATKEGKRRKALPKFNLESALKSSVTGNASGGQTSAFFLTELDDEIRRMNHEEYMQSHRSEVAVSNLIKDETDLEAVAILDRISRMKSIYNKLLIIQREKERTINDLENDIVLRQESDTHLINEVQTGESLLRSLNDRNVAMEKNLKEACILQEGYLELIKSLKLNPPYNEAHVLALETEVNLAHKQFDDLCAHRLKLYTEGEKLDNVRKQQLTERINYFKCAREEINAKKKQVIRELKHLRGAMGDRRRDNNRRHHKHRDRENGGERERTRIDRSSYSSDDSDSSKESVKDITLTQPVIHFINALVRKVTYNEPIIKDTDKSLDDVKRRAMASQDASQHLDPAPAAPAPAPAPAPITPSVLAKRRTRATELLSRKLPEQTPKTRDSDNDSAANSLQSQTRNVAAPAANMATFLSRRRLSQDEVAQLKENIKSLVHPNGNGPSRDNFKAQLQKALALMLQKTESNSFDEFIDRFLQGQSLLETLRSQQVLVDSRLSQLRAEHADLYAVWSDISFLADETVSPTMAGSPGAPQPITVAGQQATSSEGAEGNDRYLDNQLFAKEVRLHQVQRMYDKTVHVISEARTAIQHIMGLLSINAKLLAALPRSSVPVLQSDQDMANCLSWCEDRIIALNEALTMDANRPNAATNEEKSKPLSQRQADLADEIHKLLYEKKGRRGQYKAQRKTQGALSKVLIISSDANGFVSSPRGVVVPPANKIDKLYDSKITRLVNERDRQQDLNETQNYYSRDTTAQSEVQRFLAEGLDLKTTKDMSRQAKMLMNKHPGRSQTYGLVLEELMKSRGQTFDIPHSWSTVKHTLAEQEASMKSDKDAQKALQTTATATAGKPAKSASSLATTSESNS